MKSFVEIDIENNGNYLKLLAAVAKLSGLFTEKSVPFINYRVAENIFCRSFQAENLSRSDTAFDANYKDIGVGLKTFTCEKEASNEKIAEFNTLSSELRKLGGQELAIKLATFRNDRINLAKRLYGIDNSLYHIVARREKELVLFETDYNTIDVGTIHKIVESKTSLQFSDKYHAYNFNISKSTLFRKFLIPNHAYSFPVEIIDDPYSLLLDFFANKDLRLANTSVEGKDYVILPLYSLKKGVRLVHEKSGLNQWNAGGRRRDFGEIYIKIPSYIHKNFSAFFPARDEHFSLRIPTGEVFSAKVCQDNSKALMTNPNKALSNWLLRQVLQLKEGELATMEKLDVLGFNAVIVTKYDHQNFSIDVTSINSDDNLADTNDE